MRVSRFLVHRDVVGSLSHCLYDSGKISWHDDLVTDQWVFAPEVGKYDRCMKTLLSVNGVDSEFDPGAVQRKVYGKVVPRSVTFLPWSLCLPIAEYKRVLENFLTGLSKLDVETAYYEECYAAYRRLTSKFVPFEVDLRIMREMFDSASDSLVSHLESFLPQDGRTVSPPIYDFFGTRTGRLTVSSGPMVLTLPRDCRRIVKASKGKRIVQVDFASLEPRVLTALAGLPAPLADVYDEVSRSCFGGKVERDKTKVALLGTLYGMSSDTMSTKMGVPVEDCRTIQASLRKHFKVKEILRKIERETFDTTSKNFFGKIIEVSPTALLNNFVQSTAMDVAHMGFDRLVTEASDSGIDFQPFFLVHDALVGQVDRKSYDDFERLAARGFSCRKLESLFPLTTTDFAKMPSSIV